MKAKYIFIAVLYVAGLFTSCSGDEKDPTSPAVPTASFSIQSTDGKTLKDGAEILVNELDEYGELKMAAWVVNNTDKPIKLTVSQQITSTDFDDITRYASYCWDICYNLPAPATSAERTWAAGEIFKGFSGDIKEFDTTDTPSFETVIEYTIKNTESGESQKIKGHFKYKKE